MLSPLLRAALVALCFCAAPAGATAQDGRPSQAGLGDAWITTQIQAKYFLDRDIKARTIDVSTTNGTVTLSGTVASAAERQRAIGIASGIDGVRRVTDRLGIGGSERSTGTSGTTTEPSDRDKRVPGEDEIRRVTQSDPVILSQIKAKYAVDAEISVLDIDVDVADGVVTLKGDVADTAGRARAEKLAREIPGVKDVKNELRVRR